MARVPSHLVLVLAVDTSTPAVVAALVALGDVGPAHLLTSRITVDARAHAEVLTPQVLACLSEAGRTGNDLDAVVCGSGPGPYTGLRVGMMTAAAWADALGIAVHGVCSLDAIAAAAPGDGSLLVVTDARRREVYWARYDAGVRTRGPGVSKPAAVDRAQAARVAGSVEHAGLFGLPTVGPHHPDPAALVDLAAPALRSGAAPPPLVPRYLRRPDAVALGPAGTTS